VERPATRSLMEASAGLDASSRALLSLWLERGLSDDAIAEMAGLDREAVTARKLDIAQRLGDQLGRPPSDILAALSEVEPARARARRPGGPALAGALAAVGVLVVVVLVLFSLGGSSHHGSSRAQAATTTGSSAGVSTGSPAGVSTGSPAVDGSPAAVSDGSREPLKPLALRVPDASGSVTVSGAGTARKLNLTYRGLPRVGGQHYEVWLYNTIIDSRPLGRIASGSGRLSLTLPADAGTYHQIDVSLQTAGYHYDSGESVLRAANPVG
jgi:hypothetical protein